MTAIKFPLSTAPGFKLHESGGRLINCYAEPLGDGRVRRIRAPGLKAWGTTAYSGFRGFHFDGTNLYAAFEGKLVRWASASGGAATDVGDLAGSLPVFFARNNKTPTHDNVAVTDGNAFTFTTIAVSSYGDSDVGAPNCVSFQSGYFFFTYGNGTVRSSALNGTAINSLDVATAETKADSLLRPIPFAGYLYLCGAGSIEVWANTGNATGFPYSYTLTIQRGLISQRAIAGYEDGFSQSIIFAADDNTVCQLNGYTPQKISTPDLDRLIEAVSDKSTLRAKAYKSSGHSFFELSCDEWTWTYDLNTQSWHERQSYLSSTFRANNAIYAFGKWLVGDANSGNILELTSSTFKELDDPMMFRLESELVASDAGFPARQVISRADFDVVTGVGKIAGEEPIETDPSCYISWSNDELNWSTPLQRPLGKAGTPGTHPMVLNTGMAGPRGRRWRLDVYDPVYVSAIGGQQFGEPRT